MFLDDEDSIDEDAVADTEIDIVAEEAIPEEVAVSSEYPAEIKCDSIEDFDPFDFQTYDLIWLYK